MLCAVQPFRVQPDTKKIASANLRPVLAIREVEGTKTTPARGAFSVVVADDNGSPVELMPGEFKIKG